MSNIYCRFCGEAKLSDDITLLTTEEHRRNIIEKLSTVGFALVDFSNEFLPETVCVACNQHINTSYEFFLNVKRSQVVLSELFEGKILFGVGAECFTSYVPIKEENDVSQDYAEKLSRQIETEISLQGPTFANYVKEESDYMEDSYAQDSSSSSNTELLKLTWSSYSWLCAMCDHVAASINELRAHCVDVHVKCCAFKCADCGVGSDNFEEFVEHVRGHRAKLRKYCEYCNIKMKDPSHPNTHMIDDTCTICGQIFNNETSLLSHLKLYAKPAGLLAFDVEIFDLNDSQISNWAEYPTICKFCQLKMADKNVLSCHCIEVHKQCFGIKCIDCDTDVSCFKDFVEHVMKHRPVLKNVCPYCNIDMDHDDIVHVNQHSANRHPCAVCGQIFCTKRKLRAHESLMDSTPLISPPKKRRTAPLTTKDLECRSCGILMKNPASLKAHSLTHTKRKREHTCDRCGKTYYTKGSLDAHHKTHENNLQETCKICHKSFLTLARLKKHVKTHNLEMPYQCDNCKRCFSSKDRLREHVKVHMNVMPFQCQYCTKKFRFKSIMKTHENQHTGARPYSCDVCCMEFANWSNCNKHMKRKHGTTLAKTVMTPHGKLALNPKTGKPDQLFMDNVVKEWSEKMLMGREKAKKNVQTESIEMLSLGTGIEEMYNSST